MPGAEAFTSTPHVNTESAIGAAESQRPARHQRCFWVMQHLNAPPENKKRVFGAAAFRAPCPDIKNCS